MKKIDEISVQQLKKVGLSSNLLKEENLLKDDIILSTELEYNMNIFASPCRLDAFVINVCVGGEADLHINLREYKITSGILSMNIPENIIQITNMHNFKVCPIIISSDFLKKISLNVKEKMSLYMFAKKNPLIALEYSDLRSLEMYHTLAVSVLQGNDIRKEDMLKGLIYSVLFKLDSIIKRTEQTLHSSTKDRNRSEEIFELFMEQLMLHHEKERSLSFYADKLSMTANYLSKLVKDYSEKTASAWINEYVILEAKTLIKNSHYTIQEISYKLNFPSPTFFGKYFKRLTGMTPKQYKMS